MGRRRKTAWDATSVRALRRHMALTQEQLAEALGVRQQTVSEWETAAYRPRGASARLLSMVADSAGYAYDAAPGATPSHEEGDRSSDAAEAVPADNPSAARRIRTRRSR